MAKARAIVKRRKAVRNIRKITKTMQMIATAKYQKSLKRAVATKPFTHKVRELVRDLAANVGNIEHPLLRKVDETNKTNRIAVIVITSNRGLAGAYNGSILRLANSFIRQQEQAGNQIDLYAIGKKGISFFKYQKRPLAGQITITGDLPRFAEVERGTERFMRAFAEGEIDGVHLIYMNFISAGQQKPEVMTILPLRSVKEVTEQLMIQSKQKEAQLAAGVMDTARSGEVSVEEHAYDTETVYDFSPEPQELFNELLPLTVKFATFQAFLDATTSENIARMVAMKSATDNADKMVKSLTMQYNRARQTQITTELMEIMGGVEAMGGK